jgi:hypothetical protein
MNTILQNSVIGKLPMEELRATLDMFMEPALTHLPERRLQEVAELAVQGVIGGQSPLVTQMARGWRGRTRRFGRWRSGYIGSC